VLVVPLLGGCGRIALADRAEARPDLPIAAVLAGVARQPNRGHEWLHDGDIIESPRGLDRPIRVLEEDIPVNPRNLRATRGEAIDRQIDQSLLLPHQARAAHLHHIRPGRQDERGVAERAFHGHEVDPAPLHHVCVSLVVA
jgi:hypothetical protein